VLAQAILIVSLVMTPTERSWPTPGTPRFLSLPTRRRVEAGRIELDASMTRSVEILPSEDLLL
jgi:hypothetical protein